MYEVIIMFSFFGLGKSRSKFGRWIDRKGISQIEVEKMTGLSRGTISRICNDEDYIPKFETIGKIKKAFARKGIKIPDDYFNM